ncbi:MAG: hypothetical protein JWM16_2834 [Verrucomicrobiales bacterium]|nr:hypothetical protein [Verrucomicrobiales bacterium]
MRTTPTTPEPAAAETTRRTTTCTRRKRGHETLVNSIAPASIHPTTQESSYPTIRLSTHPLPHSVAKYSQTHWNALSRIITGCNAFARIKNLEPKPSKPAPSRDAFLPDSFVPEVPAIQADQRLYKATQGQTSLQQNAQTSLVNKPSAFCSPSAFVAKWSSRIVTKYPETPRLKNQSNRDISRFVKVCRARNQKVSAVAINREMKSPKRRRRSHETLVKPDSSFYLHPSYLRAVAADVRRRSNPALESSGLVGTVPSPASPALRALWTLVIGLHSVIYLEPGFWQNTPARPTVLEPVFKKGLLNLCNLCAVR